jgi:BolA protein|tara:strand:- start:1661 stop:1915 length:255 start_codon:yes stop_codon:yes gene_type:complete
MKEFLDLIENKIKKEIDVDEIKILDNTKKHKKHTQFDKNKYHISLEIKSPHLNSMDRLSAQREIMKILKAEMESKIHALEIKIK